MRIFYYNTTITLVPVRKAWDQNLKGIFLAWWPTSTCPVKENHHYYSTIFIWIIIKILITYICLFLLIIFRFIDAKTQLPQGSLPPASSMMTQEKTNKSLCTKTTHQQRISTAIKITLEPYKMNTVCRQSWGKHLSQWFHLSSDQPLQRLTENFSAMIISCLFLLSP